MKDPIRTILPLSFAVSAMILLPFALLAASVSVPADGGAVLRVLESGYNKIAGSARFEVPGVEEVETPQGTFSELSLEGTTASTEVGRPDLPVMRRIFQIPMGADPSLAIESIRQRRVSGQEIGVIHPVMPVQPPIPKYMDPADNLEFTIDSAFYSSDHFYPDEPARIVETGIIRGHAYAVVEFYPVRYNPARNEFLLLGSADFDILLEGSDPARTEYELNRYASLPFEKILSKIFVNHGTYVPDQKMALPPPLGLLVIVPDAYYSDALAYVDWKVQKGFYTTVAPLSETGGTRNEIYAYIQNAYLNWDVPPTYVLLFGDTNLIPCYDGSTGNHATDLKYASVEGGDWLPDLIVGRFPFRTSGQLVVMMQKNNDYETLNLPSTDFMNSACFIASNDPWNWGLAEDTHRYVILNYMRPNGIFSTPIRGHSGGNTQDIADAVNQGQFIVTYSGHGAPNYWDGPHFDQGDIRSLTNQDMYPFVTSHACDTGSYDNNECFGETWLREANKGGLAFWGASNSTYWDEDDFLERRMYDIDFLRSYTTIGEMTYASLYWMYLAGWGRSHYYFEVYNILGDPTVDIYMGYPVTADVTYPDTVGVGLQDFPLEVLENGNGVQNALVCVMKGAEVYETGFTDSNGDVTLSIDPTTSGTMGVSVTAHDMVPDEGTVLVQ